MPWWSCVPKRGVCCTRQRPAGDGTEQVARSTGDDDSRQMTWEEFTELCRRHRPVPGEAAPLSLLQARLLQSPVEQRLPPRAGSGLGGPCQHPEHHALLARDPFLPRSNGKGSRRLEVEPSPTPPAITSDSAFEVRLPDAPHWTE